MYKEEENTGRNYTQIHKEVDQIVYHKNKFNLLEPDFSIPVFIDVQAFLIEYRDLDTDLWETSTELFHKKLSEFDINELFGDRKDNSIIYTYFSFPYYQLLRYYSAVLGIKYLFTYIHSETKIDNSIFYDYNHDIIENKEQVIRLSAYIQNIFEKSDDYDNLTSSSINSFFDYDDLEIIEEIVNATITLIEQNSNDEKLPFFLERYIETIRKKLKRLFKKDLKTSKTKVIKTDNHVSQSQKIKDLYTREETAKYFNISLPTLNTYTKNGYIVSSKIGRKVYYSRESIEKAIIESKIKLNETQNNK